MNFDQLLESIGCPFSEHEVQGYMIGLLSQNLKNNYKTELDTYLKYSTNDTKCQETINQYTIFLLEMLTKKELQHLRSCFTVNLRRCFTFNVGLSVLQQGLARIDWGLKI